MSHTKYLNTLMRKYEQEAELLRLVDTMASAATNMNAQNYELLLQTRQEFREKLHEALNSCVKEAII